MGKIIVIASLLAAGLAGNASAQRSTGDRALGAELNRDKAETRIERLRQDQRQKEKDERPAARGSQRPAGNSTQQQSR